MVRPNGKLEKLELYTIQDEQKLKGDNVLSVLPFFTSKLVFKSRIPYQD